MLQVAQIEDWLGQDVLDSAGERVGKLDDVYYAQDSQEAVFAVVKSGLLGRHSTIAPLDGASVGREYVKLAYSAEQIADADADGTGAETLPGPEAQRIGSAYGLRIDDGELGSAGAINARRETAREAADRAASLDEEARIRAAEADQAGHDASAASAEASQKAADAQRARDEAEQARAEAEQIAPG
jgi:sporulation protein YlmC with PRC-barrel domain